MNFKPRPVYVASSWMAPVGRYNGREKPKYSFLELSELSGEVFNGSQIGHLGCCDVFRLLTGQLTHLIGMGCLAAFLHTGGLLDH